MLRVALEELSEHVWQDVADVGDAPLGRGEGRVLGSLPPITFHQDQQWRRQMARCFDDLAADLAETRAVRPRCTGEEMALHLPGLEKCPLADGHARILWMLPVTAAAMEYRRTHGHEALERLFHEYAIVPTDPRRPSVV